MGLRGHIGKLVIWTGAILTSVISTVPVLGGAVTWNKGAGTLTYDLNDSANWNGGVPANGSNVFMVWTIGSNNKTQAITNAPSDTFFADSLSLTNASTANGNNVTVVFSGAAFFTNGVGQINFGGTTGSGNLSLQFSSNVTFKTLTMTGASGTGVGTLTLAGAASGNNIVFNGGTGNSFLNINGPLGLTGALIATNINATSAGTLAGNATIGQLIFNNAANGRFTIAGNTILTGAVASVGGGFTIASTATISLGGTGGLILSNVAPLINGTLNVSNQTLNAKTNWANNGTVQLAGGFIVGNNLTNNAGATVLGFGTLSNLLVNSGTLTVTNGTLNVTTAPVQNGIVNLESLATLNVVPAWSNSGTVNLRGGVLAGGNVTNATSGTMAGFGTLSNLAQNFGVLTASNGTLTVSGLPVQNGTVGAANNGILNYLQDWTNSGTLTNAATGTVIGGTITNAAAGTIKGGGFINPLLINQGRMDFGGTVSNNFIQTAGSFTVNGSATITGNATISGGAVNLVGNKLTAGQFVVTGGGLLTNSVTGATINGGITNAGTVSFFSDVFVNGPVTNTGTWFQKGVISNDVINSGTFSLFKNSVNPLITGGILNSGSLVFDNNNSPTVNGSITNTGSVAFNAVVGGNYVQTAGSLTINQASGNAVVKGTASISGGTFDLNGKTYSNGLMVVSGSGVLTNSVAGATFNGGLSNADVVAVTANTFFNGPITNTGSFFFQGAISNNFIDSGTVKLNNDATITGTASITAGIFNLNGMNLFNSAMSLTGSSMLTNTVAGASVNGGISNAATISVSTDTFFKGTVTNTGSFFFQGAISNNLVSSGAVFLNNNATITGTASITAGTFDLNGRILTNGLMVVSGSGVLTNSVAGATLRGSANLQNTFLSGSTVTNAGTLSGSGTISASLVNAAGGSLTATNGILTVTAAPAQNGAVNVATSGKLDVAQAWQNNGTVNMLGGTLVDGDTTNTAAGAVIGFGTISNLMVNLGTLTATNGTLLLAAAPVQNGAVNVATSGKLDVTQDWQNNGSINMQGGFLVDGTLTNLAGHIITGFGTISNLLVNSGILIATNGTLNLVAKPSGSGTINIMSSGTLNVTPDWQNGGMLNLRGGTLAGGNFTNATGSVLTGVGTISSLLVNSGTLTATNGTLSLSLAPVGNGTINVATSGTMTVGQAWLNSSALNMLGGSVAGATLTNAGTISGTGSFNALLVNQNYINFSGTIATNFLQTAGIFTLNGNGTITGIATISGGAFDLNGQNYTNGLMVLNGSGVLTSSVAGASFNGGLSNAATVAITPGVFFKGLITNTGTVFFNGGVLSNNLVTSGTVTLNNSATITGNAVVNGGGFDLNGQSYTNNLMVLSGTGVLTSSVAGASFNGGLSNAATVAITPSVFFKGLITNTGTIFFNGGVLSNNLVTSGTVTLNNSATITGNAVANGGRFNLNGQSYSNALMIIGGTGVLTNGVAGATFNGGLSNAATVAVTANTFFNGPITNTGAMFFQGAISNALVNRGSFNLNNSATLTAAPINTGTMNLDGVTFTVVPAWANSGTVILNGGILAGGALTNNVGGNIIGFGTLSNLIANLGTLTATNGALQLVDVPIQSGTFNIVTSGVLQVSGNLTNSGVININSGGSLTGAGLVVMNAGTLNDSASNGISGANITINGGTVVGGVSNALSSGTIIVNNTGILQSQFQTALGSSSVTVNTNGTLRFNGNAQNPTNAITLNSGAIVEANAALTLNSANVALPTAGLIVFNGTSSITISNAYPALTGNITFDGNSVGVTVGALGETGGSHSVTKSGSGVLNFIGTNTYSGGTVVNAGTLNANAAGALGLDGITLNGGTVNLNATNAYVGSSDITVGSQATLVTTIKGGTPFGGATIYNYGTLAISGANGSMVGNTNNVVFQPGSTLLINQTGQTNGSTYDRWGDSQAIALNGSTLMLRGIANSNAAPETVGNVSFAGGSHINLTDQGGGVTLVINSNLTRVGRATLEIDPSAALTGTALSGGANGVRLVVNSPVATSNGMAAPYLVDTLNNTFVNYVRSGSSTGFVDAVTTQTDINNATSNDVVLVQGSSGNQLSHDLSLWALRVLGKNIPNISGGPWTITNRSGGLIVDGADTISPNLVFGSAEALIYVSSGSSGTLAGNVSGSNGLTKFGMGNLALGGSANTFSGPVTVNEGLLQVASGNGLANTNELTVGEAGTFDMNVNQVIGGLADLGTVTNSTAIARSLTILNTNTFVFSGTIAGPLSLTKQGLATQTLAGANSYTGQTTVAAGTLLVHGSLNSGGGTVTVNSGATLGGTGTVSRAVVVNTGGAILVNNGTAPFTLNGGSVFNSGVVTANFGQLIIGGVFTNAGTFSALNGSVGTISSAMFNSGSMLLDASTLNAALSWRNTGVLNLLNGTVLGGALTNAGRVSGSGTIGPSVINNSGATITASSGGTLTLTAIPLQNGLVNILGTLNVASAWSNGNAGTVTINGGVLTGGTFTVDGAVTGNGTISANMVISNARTLTVNGGQMNLTALTTMGGGIINGGPGVNNFGTMSGAGTIGATLANTGYIRATNGLLSIQTLAGNQVSGVLEASTGGTLGVNGVTPWLNNGQIILSGGTVIGGAISNNASKVISGFGTISPNVYNSGQIQANNPGQVLTLNNSLANLVGGVVSANTGNLVINGTFTNAGTLNMIHSVGTFSGAVVNSGAWVTDPTINVFQNTYTVTSSGFIQSSAGDVYIFSNNATTAANFINVSTNKSQYDTRAGDFVFANTLGLTQVFAAAGHDFGPAASMATNRIEGLNADPFSLSQYSNNFALGTLEISSFTTVRVTDAFSALGPGTNDGFEAALYLDNLFLGSNSLLLIDSNVQLYFINSNSWSMANVQLDGNPNFDNSLNGIHQLAVIPEPSVVLLWLSGITTLGAARRRHARERR